MQLSTTFTDIPEKFKLLLINLNTYVMLLYQLRPTIKWLIFLQVHEFLNVQKFFNIIYSRPSAILEKVHIHLGVLAETETYKEKQVLVFQFIFHVKSSA